MWLLLLPILLTVAGLASGRAAPPTAVARMTAAHAATTAVAAPTTVSANIPQHASTRWLLPSATPVRAGGIPLADGLTANDVIAAEAGPGAWGAASESMSARAAAYQGRITGAADGQVYRVGGVKFDGFTDGVLQEAKGPGYAKFVKNGEFQPWFGGAEDMVGQAQRQLGVAGGSPITWSFAESDAAAAVRNLFSDRGISGINVVWAP